MSALLPPTLAAFSPIVARLVDANPRLVRFVARAPRAAALGRVPSSSPSSSALARRCLRLLRKRVLVFTAAAERAGTSPLVTARLWSDVADAALDLADRVAFAENTRRLGAIAPARAILGLGKLGSRELNPSSDVDVVCVYGSDDVTSDRGVSAHEWFTSWARRVRAILADVDQDGFAFRVDFDLRPEGTRGPLVNSVDAIESYYERFGRTWERAALLRMRAVVDVGGAGAEILRRLRPFVFKKNIDERLLDEIFALKAAVTSSSSSGPGGAGGFDVKRGRGGIREVEFIAQSLLLLHAGRVPPLQQLQGADTVTTLRALEQHGLLPHQTARDLCGAYEVLRSIEHALQLGEDRQTQWLPDDGPERARVAIAVAAARSTPGRPARFDDLLSSTRERVHEAFVRHLGEARSETPPSIRAALDPTLSDDERTSALRDAGFGDPVHALAILRLLERRRGSLLSPGSRVDERTRRFGDKLVEHIARSVDPIAAIERLPDVMSGRVHAALLERLADDDRSVAVIARMLALSAPLSRALAHLARHGGVDDALLFGVNARRPSAPGLDHLLSSEREGDDDEARVVAMRRVQQEALFSAALPFLAHAGQPPAGPGAVVVNVVEAQRRLSVVADACVRRAFAIALARVTRRHGTLPGGRFVVLALGSLGGRELGFFRDLDLAFVYDAPGGADTVTDGARPIDADEWGTRLAQQVLWVLTAPLEGGALYPVDTRLRPSGSQGALTTSLQRFDAYHRGESQLWERQALLRLRPIAGDRALGRRVVAVVRAALAQPAPVGLGLRLLDMRARMVEERAAHGVDVKLGEGGLADVEFAVQGAQLSAAAKDPAVLLSSTRRALGRLLRRGWLRADEARTLRASFDHLSHLREALAIVDDARDPSLQQGDPRLDRLARAGALPGAADGAAAFRDAVRVMATVREVSGRILMRLA